MATLTSSKYEFANRKLVLGPFERTEEVESRRFLSPVGRNGSSGPTLQVGSGDDAIPVEGSETAAATGCECVPIKAP
jgi:hypothetical protein